MKKQNKRFVSLALSLVMALALVPSAVLAAGVIRTQMIEANYMGIRVVINGVEVEPKDAAGHTVEPFASNGTTYLPVRAVAQALGQDVEWDGETKTVYIGDNIPGKETNWMTKLPPYQVNQGEIFDGSDHTKSFTVAGNEKSLGVTLYNYSKFYGGLSDTDGCRWKNGETTATALWNTNCQYKTMNFTIGHMGNTQVDCKLEIYLDGVYSTTIDLPWDGAPKKLSLPINYAPNVKMELLSASDEGPDFKQVYSYYGLYDISFTEE